MPSTIRKLHRLLVAFSLLSSGLLGHLAIGIPPKELAQRFFKKPQMEDARLSPGNQYLSYLSDKGSRALVSYEFATGRLRDIRAEERGDIYDYYWTSREQLLVFAHKLGIPSQVFSTSHKLSQTFPTDYVEVYDLLPDVKNKLIIKDTDRSDKFFDLELFDLSIGSRKTIAQNPGHIISWYTDKDGVIRIRQWVDENERDRFEYRRDEGSPWREIDPGSDSYGILFLNEPEKILSFHLPEGGDRVIGRFFDCAANSFYGDPIEDPHYDIIPHDFILDPETEETFGFRYHAEKQKSYWFRPEHRQLQHDIDKRFPDTVNEIHGFAHPSNQAVARRSSDRNPGVWLLYDKATGTATPIGEERPWIDKEATAPTESIVFPNREGDQIHALLTRPKASADRQALLVMIHGGPRARDLWGWDSEAQYFAALGYTVLKINYRGSSGYGIAYSPYSHLDAIRDSIVDTADGVQWALGQGYAREDRVAIYGSSFGGHVSLRCAAEYPDFFACVIAYAGVYDWVKEMDREFAQEPVYWKLKMRTYYGDYENEKDQWKAASAISMVDKIAAPVYLLHGGSDEIVASRQSKLMRNALKKAGKDVTLKILSFNNHGMVLERPTIRFYENLANFLEQSIPLD